jgi:hypothetical protein
VTRLQPAGGVDPTPRPARQESAEGFVEAGSSSTGPASTSCQALKDECGTRAGTPAADDSPAGVQSHGLAPPDFLQPLVVATPRKGLGAVLLRLKQRAGEMPALFPDDGRPATHGAARQGAALVALFFTPLLFWSL